MGLQQAKICIGCWQQLRLPVPLRGVLSAPFRLVGIRPSRMNPNTCTMCEMLFPRLMKARNITIDATVLFADLRGYTTLSQSLPTAAVTGILDAFYDECASAIWEQDGLLNKTIGDAIMAIFNFPIHREDHAEKAVRAAQEVHRRCELRRRGLTEEFGLSGSEIGVGIGIDSGEFSFGEYGRSHRDLTAIGTIVNTAARAQAAASAGQTLVTKAVYDRTRQILGNGAPAQYALKGFSAPVELYEA